jgi:hypothetical protein
MEGVTVEEAYKRAGGWGRFQKYLLAMMILACNSAGLVDNGLAYLELDP